MTNLPFALMRKFSELDVNKNYARRYHLADCKL
jgi:hypothetical protein